MRPRLKGIVWERLDGELRVVYDLREQLIIGDPDGTVEELLQLLREGGRTAGELSFELTRRSKDVSTADVRSAIALLNSHGLLEDGDRASVMRPAERERFFSNLAFFESFASLDRAQEDFHGALREAHALVLGTGGLGANTIPHLCGMGVGQLTLLDCDVVESRNFARQFLYRWRDIGSRKVHQAARWVRAFDPSIRVRAIDSKIDGPGTLTGLLDQLRPTVVLAGVDHPDEIDSWVNTACVSKRVPFVRAGMWVTQGVIWSVDPHKSACHECARVEQPADAGVARELAAARLYGTKARTNRGIGPVAGLLGALAAFEILRYVTRFEPPAYAGRPALVDFASGCAVTQDDAWVRRPDCATCGLWERSHRPAPGLVGATG